ncbi:hypothetical protein EDB89DRAFT_873436 [Lactarius sanguifluus]|nr:hypothetical protein EDB89DRAFT_873436 [Lactarius sanguifluus]
MRRLVRLVSRISSDASPVSPLRMRRSFWDLRWKKCVGLPFDLCAHGCALFLSTPPRAAQWPLRRVLGGQVRRLVPSFLRSPYGSAPPLRYQDSLLLPVRGGTLLSLWLRAASVSSRETHRLDRRQPSFRVRIRLIGIRSTLSQPRPLGRRELLLPSQRLLFNLRHDIWRSIPSLCGAMRHLRPYRRLSNHLLPLLASTLGRQQLISIWVLRPLRNISCARLGNNSRRRA